jgi:hypothetical protein
LNEYGKHLPDLVKRKSSYKNYREFMLKVLECKRNEENKPFDPETAQQYATELYNAGGGRTIGTIRYGAYPLLSHPVEYCSEM